MRENDEQNQEKPGKAKNATPTAKTSSIGSSGCTSRSSVIKHSVTPLKNSIYARNSLANTTQIF